MTEQQSTPAGETTHEQIVEIHDRPKARRYEISVDGVLAGFADYERGVGQITFTHSEMDDAFAGRGLAGLLARKSLDDARAAGEHVLPLCPFYRSWMQRHADYADLVPEERREEFGL
jgi:predicted GNAT family acetyltransferase